MKSGIVKPQQRTLARQRQGKQVPAEMNTHATVKLPFLCNGEINTLLL
jgi:hypothetical protein